MKKFRGFIFAIAFVCFASVLFVACKKEEKKQPTVNPVLDTNTYYLNQTLSDVEIRLSDGDTPGTLVWKNSALNIFEGENSYTWVFVPDNEKVFKKIEGTLDIIGVEPTYSASASVGTVNNWDYDGVVKNVSLSVKNYLNQDLTPVFYTDNGGQLEKLNNIPNIVGDYVVKMELNSVELKSYNCKVQYFKRGTRIPLDSQPVDAGSWDIEFSFVNVEDLSDTFVVSCQFEINKKDIGNYSVKINDWNYGTEPSVPKIYDENNNEITNVNVRYTYRIKNGVIEFSNISKMNVGNYEVFATIDDVNYSGERKVCEFSILKADVDTSKVSIYLNNWVYGEAPNAPMLIGISGVSVTYKYALVSSTEFVDTCPINAGNYKVKAIITSSNNYNPAEIVKEFSIAKAESSAVHQDIEINEGEHNTVETISLSTNWKWDNTDVNYSTPLIVGENVRKAIFESENYLTKSQNIVVKVLENKNAATSLSEVKEKLSDNTIAQIEIVKDVVINENLIFNKNVVVKAGVTLTVHENASVTLNNGVTIAGNVVNNGKLIVHISDFANLNSSATSFVLDENVALTEELMLTKSLDLNSKTISGARVALSDGITIKNGTISGEVVTNGVVDIVNMTLSAGLTVNEGSLTITDSNISGDTAITVISSEGITISDSRITANSLDGYPVYFNNAEVVEGGLGLVEVVFVAESEFAIYIKNQNVSVNHENCTFNDSNFDDSMIEGLADAE